MNNFIGKDGFIWWTGVVEGVNDPLNLGRCQVRIFGWHSENLNEMPVKSLPWALPMLPVNASTTSSKPFVGDFVVGFFMDGMSAQAPMIMGVLPGIIKNGPNKSKGFSTGTYYPVGEPTTSRLYRNEKISETAIGQHNSSLDTNVSTANGGSWSEPASQYAVKPPYNNVTQTESGHVFELDDTPGKERVHLAHKNGSFFEIAADGTKVTKVTGKNYEIYLSDNNVHIKGACNITVDGAVNLMASEVNVEGPLNIKGDVDITGKVTASGDVVGSGISLSTHVHGGVRTGPSTTSGPQ